MNVSLPILLAAVLLAGCSQTLSVVPAEEDTNATYSFDEANARLQGRYVEVALEDGRTMPSQTLVIAPDSTAWMDLMTDRVRSAPTPAVDVIRHKQAGRGAIQGALFGGGSGVLLGTLVGALLLDQQKDDAGLSEAGFVSRFSMGGLIFGTGVGVSLGAKRGSYDTYVYPDPIQSASAE